MRTLHENPEPAHVSQRTHGANPDLIGEIIEADVTHRKTLQAFEALRATQEEVSESVGRAPKEERPVILTQAERFAERVKATETAANAADAEADRLARLLPGLVPDGVSVGGGEDFVILRHGGPAPRDFVARGLKPQGHLAFGEGLDAIGTKRGAKVSGARFYYLKNISARLELALMTMVMDQALVSGFVPMITPILVAPQIMGDTGLLNKYSDEVYYLPADDLCLTGTSEVTFAGYHADKILDPSDNPERYMGWSACYRREAGSAGKDARGIIRAHQFNKAEMSSYCCPEGAVGGHQRFFTWEEEMFTKVELPYRIIDMAAGNLGTSAARKFGYEARLPTQECYMGVTLTSSCVTFQTRRLGVHERREDGVALVTTLSDTLATIRWTAAFLENHQQASGSVYMPEALRPYLGGLEALSPVVRWAKSVS